MLKHNCLSLLIIISTMLVFACTTKREKNPPSPIDNQQNSQDNEALEELQRQLQDQKSLYSSLQQKLNNTSGMSAEEKQALQDQFEATQKATQAAQDNAQKLAEALAAMDKFKQELEAAKKKVEEEEAQGNTTDTGNNTTDTGNTTTSTGNTTTTNTGNTTTTAGATAGATASSDSNQLPNPNAPLEITVWLEEQAVQGSKGTYVKFGSNEDITATQIAYGEFKFEAGNDDSEFEMTLPVYLKFKHDNTDKCFTATLTRAHWPQTKDQGTKIEMASAENNSDCKHQSEEE